MEIRQDLLQRTQNRDYTQELSLDAEQEIPSREGTQPAVDPFVVE